MDSAIGYKSHFLTESFMKHSGGFPHDDTVAISIL